VKGGANDCVLRVQSQNASGSWTPPIAPLAVSMASMVIYDHDRVYERGMVVNGVEGGYFQILTLIKGVDSTF